MDTNKLKVLREIDYSILSHCGICEHSDLSPGSTWGCCNVHTYQHLKHSEDTSRLSIHRTGSCNKFAQCVDKVTALGLKGFGEFVKES